ncbi:MAG TPA: hypothetical protein VFW93_05730 [Aquabacterium sp.]|nr:hypothetical protein [Aquabacterium sp.]
MKNRVACAAISLVLAGCGHMNVPVTPERYQGRTGVVVTASHRLDQTFLYFVSGVKVSFDNQSPATVPWGEATFFDKTEGRHAYRIWYDYLGGGTGSVVGCVRIPKDGIVLIQYKTPYTALQGGEVEITSADGHSLDVGC